MNDLTLQQQQEVQVQLSEIEEEFNDIELLFGKEALGFAEDEGSSEALDALNVELEGSGLIGGDNQSVGQMSLMALADGEIDAQSLGLQFWNPFGWLKKKAAKIIRKIVALVKRYKKYLKCVPAVTKAVALFKAGKYGSALKQAYSAYSCIRNA